MNVLLLAGTFPAPATDGWRIRVLSLLRALARRHRVTLCSFASREPDPRAVTEMRELCDAVHWVRRNPRYGMLTLLRGAVGSTPFPILNYRSRAMGALVQQVMAAGRFDVVHVEDIHMAQYAARHAGVRTVLDLHNVDSGRMRRFARHQRNPFTRLYALLTARKLARYEAHVASAYDLVLACSEDDRALLSAGGVQADVLVVPNGVDISRFAPRPAPSRPRHLVFVGRMDYAPNADAVLFFCRSILPLIRAAHDDVTLAIVGQHPPRAVRALSSTPGVTVTGFVDDVRPYVADAAVVIVPLRFGSGTRLKILEAMAMGKAVVSTTIGCEGIRATSGAEILLADEAPAFASAVVGLLESQTARLDLGQRARQRAVSDYSWTRIGEDLLAAYDGLPARPSRQRLGHHGHPTAISVPPRAATTDQAR